MNVESEIVNEELGKILSLSEEELKNLFAQFTISEIADLIEKLNEEEVANG